MIVMTALIFLASLEGAVIIFFLLRLLRSNALLKASRREVESLRELAEGFYSGFDKSILDSLTVGISALDSSLRILTWNQFMASLTERPIEEVLGRPYFEVFPEQLGTGLPDTLEEVLKTGETREIRNFKHQGKSKRTYVTRKKICPLKRSDGAVEGVIIISEDVTEKVLLGEELRRVEKLKAVGEFAAGLAHEINNPIGIISAYAQHLAESMEGDSACSPSYVRGVRAIQEEAERCSGIVRNILEFSREAEAKFVAVNLPDIIDSVLFLVEQRAKSQNVTIEKYYDPSISAVIGDPDQLKQVFFNLVINAIQAMPDGGRLTISVKRDSSVTLSSPRDGEDQSGRFRDLGAPAREEQYITIEFSDTGCGIPGEYSDLIFKPFFTTKSGGTGLGLAVSEGIIKNHSGTITVKSEPGKGSTFTVRLPVGEL